MDPRTTKMSCDSGGQCCWVPGLHSTDMYLSPQDDTSGNFLSLKFSFLKNMWNLTTSRFKRLKRSPDISFVLVQNLQRLESFFCHHGVSFWLTLVQWHLWLNFHGQDFFLLRPCFCWFHHQITIVVFGVFVDCCGQQSSRHNYLKVLY